MSYSANTTALIYDRMRKVRFFLRKEKVKWASDGARKDCRIENIPQSCANKEPALFDVWVVGWVVFGFDSKLAVDNHPAV